MQLWDAILRRAALPAAVLAGLLGSGFLVWQSSYAAFTATTTNSGNSFNSGKVVLGNNSGGTALFAVNNLVPSSTGVACVDVTYSGNVASSIKFYAVNGTPTDLAPYLTFQVDQIGSVATCNAAATPVANLYGGTSSQTLAGLVSSAGTYANGLGTWTPSTATTQRYRFTYTLQDTNAAQNLGAQVSFTWEARSTGS